ncbi:TPA: hypothetical protein DCZ15_00850 [Candidatus Falkowbacteria bacterium]|nr:MAG: hypothetical protein UV95_C0003G0031 [Candidatus Falkowbacteria bacterium GW2011_GWF2_43_32]HBA36403.1 hypothetical protein [Candidatus Falkowbacteria bacterium]
MKKLMILAAAVAVLTVSCREEATPFEEEPQIIPKIYLSWDRPEELRALNVYLGFEKSDLTTEEVEELYHNSARLMIPYKGIVKMLKSPSQPTETQIQALIRNLQMDSLYCDFTELKNSLNYFLLKGRPVCVDIHEFIGYFLYTNEANDARDSSLFISAYKQILLKEFELQLAGFLERNYAQQVEDGNICLELLNEPKSDRWEDIQKDLAQAISAKFPKLCLAVRPDQSYSPNCLRATWFDPADYRNIRHLTFVNFWFAERPDIGASPMDFAIQYDKFVRYRNGEDVEFNLFGDLITGYYSHRDYALNQQLLEEEFQMCVDWANNQGEKIFFAELGCIRYADPDGQYFLNCLKLGQEYDIGIGLFEVGAQYFFNYDGDVPFYLNDKSWTGFQYLQMDPAELN